jgi:hypothetical protein
MSLGECLGWAAVISIWAAIVWLLVKVLGFAQPDYDPEERDPYD